MPEPCNGYGPIQVVHFQRRPAPGQHSMEMLAEDIRAAMPSDIEVSVRTNRFHRGVLRRLWDVLAAWWARGDVNHILGDAHYLALLLPSRRTIVTVLDCGSLKRLTGLRRWLYWLLWFHLPLRRVERVTVISESTRTELLESVDISRDRVTVIPVPISGAFEHIPRLASDKGKPRVLQVGTRPNKNLERVTEAVAELDVELVIIGRLTSRQRSALEARGVTFENHVDLTRDEVVQQYRECDVVVFVSTYEGFGMPIVEAQATGRPVVTSNISPMSDTAGGAACLVDPFNVSDIRRGIQRVLNDVSYAERIVQAGYTNVLAYSPRRVAEEYVQIYREIQRRVGSLPCARS